MSDISFSELNTYMRCPDKYHYKYVEEYENPRWWKPALKLGTYYHELQEARHKGRVDDRVPELLDEIKADPWLMTDEKASLYALVSDALELLLRWLGRYPYKETYLSAEQSVSYGGFSGTVDAVIQEHDGIILRDYKTASSIGKPLLDLQPYMYMWLYHNLGYNVLGFEYDYIRSKVPVQPTLNQNGTIRDYKRIDTTAGIFLDFLLEHNLMDNPDYRQRYTELLTEETDKWFRRDFIEWDPSMEARIRVELQGWRAKMNDYKRGMNLQAYGMTACNRCPYEDICRGLLHNEPVNLREYYDHPTHEAR